MKNICSYALLIIAALTMAIAGCKKAEKNITESETPTALKKISETGTLTIDQKRATLQSMLMDVAKYVVTEAQNNGTSRHTIYAELERNIDDDDNALIDLFADDIETIKTNEDFQASLALFSDLEGDRYFPQVFIPNYGTLKANGDINISNDITCVFYVGDETQGKAKAYKLDTDGNWAYAEEVSEAVSDSKEIWVFSLNETFVNTIDEGILTRYVVTNPTTFGSAQKPTGGHDYPCGDGVHYWPYIQYMQIRKNNESWLSGKSDIWIKTYTGWNTWQSTNPCDGTPKQILWTNNSNGQIFVAKFMRYMIPNTGKTVNCGYAGVWRPGPFNVGTWQGDAFNYVIFEKDAWPVGDKEALINNNGHPAYHTYQSNDEYYDAGIILYWDPNPALHMGNYARDIAGQIKFNSRM